ncbi:MAG TPA: hypothetical protein P5098_00440 [Candidatus Dojkabacteria bacterium]|nr:hypothetical protein [Candidatus Dojkabacteria bacterium]
MNKQTRETIVQFLQRTELKGYEVPAFNQVMQELLEEEPEEMLKDKEEIQDEDQEDQDQEPEEEITEQDIKKKKKDVSSIMAEIDGL